jgi:hypothetical protein
MIPDTIIVPAMTAGRHHWHQCICMHLSHCNRKRIYMHLASCSAALEPCRRRCQRRAMSAHAHHRSCLQVFVKGEFVGGSDILLGMHENGELEKLAESLKSSK